MAFDKPTRNRLATFVGKARDLIADEFTQQFQSLYGISDNGTVTPLVQLKHLDDVGQATAALLRERIDYFIKTHPEERDSKKGAVTRLAREQAFTILNRLAAIRMAEKRDLIVESVGKGYQSKGFKVFEQVAGAGLGDTYHRYRRYIFCLFDELAVDLGILFDRRSPQGLLFPRETALQELFTLLNASDIEPLWDEDETIGWIYQYYNDPAERKKMRDESSAPRNSRELAVRNQFFTPRYVVEFLTDNTLGRIWYEMTQGKTRLKDQCRYLVRRPTEIFLKPDEVVPESTTKDDLSQEELLKQPVYIPFRLMKDPRLLLMLDPACGSMHFGLYAFDLYEVIYEEAWDLGVESLRLDYPEKEDFLREVPRLIIEHNIHGVDIDPRAVQIAGLSLWLRAQKSWQVQRVPADKRPRIMRSNIVCAEPMPGSAEMLKEFTATLHPPILGQLVEKVFAQMQLAGEAGSLLKIEEDIATLVDEAKKLWSSPRKAEQTKFDLGMAEKPVQGEIPLDVSGISDESFWETVEERIYVALKDYAEQAEAGGYQRRLFAEDAARGFSFIDLCRKRYHVVLMNPPYGEFSAQSKSEMERFYPNSKNDFYASFVDRGVNILIDHGYVGALTSRTFLNIISLSDFRLAILSSCALESLIDLGFGVLDGAVVESCAYALQKGGNHSSCWCLRMLDDEDKEEILNSTIKISDYLDSRLFLPKQDNLALLPNRSFAYWIPPAVLDLFSNLSVLSSAGFEVKLGLQTGDNDRFLRLKWEIPESCLGMAARWVPYAKGGEYSPFYDDVHLVVNWKFDGKEIKTKASDMYGSETRTVKCQEYYFRAGLNYPLVTVKGINVRLLPADCICDNGGPGIFAGGKPLLWDCLGITNSRLFQYLLNCLTTSRHWQVGYVSVVPYPRTTEAIGNLAKQCCDLRRSFDEFDETSNVFTHSLLPSQKEEVQRRLSTFCESYSLLDQIVANIYGFPTVPDFVTRTIGDLDMGNTVSKYIDGIPDLDSTCWMLSYSIGLVLGRWDIRFASDERQPPELPDPFAPLPVCPPGMLQNSKGLPAEPKDVPADYPLRISWPGILVDDENHPEDIVARVREVLEVIWKDRTDAIEQEACELLGVKNLRDYFRRPASFFADHLKRYSKSRRQAPIYWPISTANGSYTLWIYYHRLNDQTLHSALADFVDPKLKAVRTEISTLRESGNHRDRLEELLDLERELSDFRAEIERIIKLPWKPNLNDGVIITASPLWKLFRLPKWQKDLKACWEKLEKGDYDWAHLAYSIWPKRVEEVCKKDRSIAIAHNLEHLCEEAPLKMKEKKRKKKTT